MGSLQCTIAPLCRHSAGECDLPRPTILGQQSLQPLLSLCAWRPLHQCHIKHKIYAGSKLKFLPRARSLDDIEPVPPATLPPLNSVDELEYESLWISGMIRCWLDDEWTPQEVHRDLGEATSRIYMELRQEGVENEVGDVVLGIGAGLLGFNFRECFVGPFDVANKVSELLMLRRGCDVCCVSEADKEAIERWEAIVLAELEKSKE